jgi:hypothetical protein
MCIYKIFIISIILLNTVAIRGYAIIQHNKVLVQKEPIEGSFKIIKIKRQKRLYILYASKDNTCYKIISVRKKQKHNQCIKIKKGNYYYLKLNPYFGKYDMTNSFVTHIIINETAIPLIDKKISVNNIYSSQNLEGIFYCK